MHEEPPLIFRKTALTNLFFIFNTEILLLDMALQSEQCFVYFPGVVKRVVQVSYVISKLLNWIQVSTEDAYLTKKKRREILF